MKAKSISFPFPDISDSDLEKTLEPYVTKIRVEAKTQFIRPHESSQCMYYIHSGSTRHYMVSPEGVEKILYVLTPGWLFGEPWFFMDTSTRLYTNAETDVELWKINYKQLDKLLAENHEFRNMVFQGLTYKVLFLRYEIESLCFNSCQERLMRTICMCVDESAVIDGNWYGLKIQYTHYDLGVLIGSVRVTVSKLINNLCNEGLIRLVNRKIQVNIDAYQEYMDRYFEQFVQGPHSSL